MMSAGDFVWGALLIGSGVFVGIYGEMLFKFVLAIIGFAAAGSAVYILLDGKSTGLQVLMAIIAGGIGALVLYRLLNFALYIAGAAFGAVAGIVIAALIGLNTTDNLQWITLLLVVVGAGGVGFFGPRFGRMIIPLATSAVSAGMVVYGYLIFFQSTFGIDASDPNTHSSRKSLLLLFAIVYALSFLAQYNISKYRLRLRPAV